MRQDYVFDRISKYSVDQIDEDLKWSIQVNRRNIERYVSTLRQKGPDWFFNREEKRGDCYKLNEEKLQEADRLINEFYSIADVARILGVTEGALRYHIKKGTIKQQKVQAELEGLQKQEADLLKQRKAIPYKTTIKEMGDNKYNKLNTESKLFLNVIKMICYRAETSLANILAPDYKKHINQ
jgi:predicted transcriptional regulator